LIHQFTSPRCKNCGVLKAHIQERFSDESVQWISTDVLESDELTQRFGVTGLPRFDISRNGHTVASFDKFDATVANLTLAMEKAMASDEPQLTLDEDF
jgi:protein-disulfide isomerase-like protein with CxxC motif